MDYQLIVRTAVLAGELMLCSGAETYRVEDTMNHILRTAKTQTAEALVFMTGIVATVDSPDIEPVTVMRRVKLSLIQILIGFALNYAAYFAEIYRSGIESIPRGQYEAAALLGYSKVQTFFKIVLPQVIKIILPSVTNEVITLVKDTSLVYSLSYIEMFAIAKQIRCV